MYAEMLGDEQLGSSIRIIQGGGIFDDESNSSDDEKSLTLDAMNAQLKNSSDSIEFLPASPIEDLPFEAFKKSTQKVAK